MVVELGIVSLVEVVVAAGSSLAVEAEEEQVVERLEVQDRALALASRTANVRAASRALGSRRDLP